MEITPWKYIDESWLRSSLESFLRSNVARGGDLLPTSRNVSSLLSIGYAGSRNGDPCLVAIIAGEPIGFVLWAGMPPGLDCRWKTVYAHGSFTSVGARSAGVAGALRAEALRMSKALGYERVIGPVAMSNAKGISEFVSQGAWPTHCQMELLL